MDKDELNKQNEKDRPIIENMGKLLSLLEKRLDAQEQIMAKIILAYPEIFATVQALIQTLVGSLEEDEQQQFIALIEEYRNDSLKKMSDLAEQMERTDDESATPSEESSSKD